MTYLCGTTVRECGAMVTECGTTVTECGTTVTECGTTVTECGAMVTECGTTVMECGAMVTECGTTVIFLTLFNKCFYKPLFCSKVKIEKDPKTIKSSNFTKPHHKAPLQKKIHNMRIKFKCIAQKKIDFISKNLYFCANILTCKKERIE